MQEKLQKRILILTADVGFGHRSAANAIAAALNATRKDHCLVEIFNPLDDKRTPAILRDAQADYDRLVREAPERYKLQYKLGDSKVPNALFESAVTVMLFNVLRDIILKFRPDVIVTTHPMYPAPVSAVLTANELAVPFIIVVTDFVDVHISWLHKWADLWIVPTRAAYEQAVSSNLPKERIHVAGIPVRPEIVLETRTPAEIRQKLGWDKQITTLLAVGSKRVNHLSEVLHVLNHSSLPLQLILVAGGDEELYKELKNVEWHLPAHVYGFVEDMSSFLNASDCILTKAGGLIITESLAAGLPMLFVDVTPGQELGNAEYVIKNRAGEMADNPIRALEVLCHLLQDDAKLLHEYRKQVKKLSLPNSAFTIADMVWSAAEQKPWYFTKHRADVLPKLMDLLAGFEINPGNNLGALKK